MRGLQGIGRHPAAGVVGGLQKPGRKQSPVPLCAIDTGKASKGTHARDGEEVRIAGEASAGVASGSGQVSAHKYLCENFAPVSECPGGAISDGFVVLEGAIPESMQGVFARNGPNLEREAPQDYHPWDGDGMVHAVWFGKDGDGKRKLVYKNKFVDTLGRKVENLVAGNRRDSIYPGMKAMTHSLLKRAGLGIIKKALPAWMFGLKQDSGEWGDTPLLIFSKNVANTGLAFHHGKLLALWEGGFPYELDPFTLETIGPYTFGGALKQSLSAHPQVDPKTGEMIDVRYYLLSNPYCTVRVWNKQGQLQHEAPVGDATVPVLMHDCAITENYTILPRLPLCFIPPYGPDAQEPGKEKSLLCFEPEKGGRIGVMPRYGTGEDTKWFDVSPNFVFHIFNAYEDGDKVVLHGIRMKEAISGWDPVTNPEMAIGILHEYELDMVTGQVQEHSFTASHVMIEMPCINPAFLGCKARYGFAGGYIDPVDNMRFTSCEKIDLLSRDKPPSAYTLPEGSYAGEFAFVSKAPSCDAVGKVHDGVKNKSDGSDDGWLVSFVHNEVTGKSEILIIDATDMSLASRVQLPARVPYGFHCTFIPQQQLPPGYALT